MKYRQLISEMTQEEKASLTSGADFWHTKAVPRLGVPQMLLSDGPHGVRRQKGKSDHLGLNASYPSTCFPTASAAANSWDEALIEQMGRRLGAEARAQGVSVLLGPGVNIKRSPLCGRNFEYYSEDPLLAGKCAAALIRGIQSAGIAACVKHFAANSQETLRMTSDSVVDERTLREIYLPAFELAVKEGGVKCLMTSYNRLNGEYTNENTHLLQDILTRDWGYDGLIVTDWGGDNDRVRGLLAGNALEMPGTGCGTDEQVLAALRSGEISREVIDERIDSILRLVFDGEKAISTSDGCNLDEHHEFAVRLAAECAVLLKNDGILPLKKTQRIAVIGDFARTPRYQGAGSSRIEPTKLPCGLDALAACGVNIIGYEPGFRRGGGKSRRLEKRAAELAKKADAVVLWLGLDENSEAEGVDRRHMRIPENQRQLLHTLHEVNPNIAVVLSCGSAVETQWDSEAAALLYTGLGGQGGAEAAAKLLTGEISPSGKLSETFPHSLADTPSADIYPGREAAAEYREGIYVGYRYYDTAHVAVKYPFGFGMSYTKFEYSELEVNRSSVSFTIKNVGSAAGAEIAQVYAAPPRGDVFFPEKSLCGFARVFLMPDEERRVTVEIPARAFEYWNTAESKWASCGGEYGVLVGASSRNIRLRGRLDVAGGAEKSPYTDSVFAPYFSAEVGKVSDEAFAALLGRELTPVLWDRKAPLEFNSALIQGRYKSGVGRFIYGVLELAHRLFRLCGSTENANNAMFAMSLPYRGLARFTGFVTQEQVNALLRLVNGEKGAFAAFVASFVRK